MATANYNSMTYESKKRSLVESAVQDAPDVEGHVESRTVPLAFADQAVLEENVVPVLEALQSPPLPGDLTCEQDIQYLLCT